MSRFCNLEEFDCDMSIDPKIRDYLEKKKYYKDNNITPLVPLEQSLSKEEIQKIKKYYNSNTNDNSKKSKSSNTNTEDNNNLSYISNNFVDTRGQYFESSRWKKDPRFEKIEKKQQRDKHANLQRRNYSNLENKYDMYNYEKNFSSAIGNDFNNEFNCDDIISPPISRDVINKSRSNYNETSLKKDSLLPEYKMNNKAPQLDRTKLHYGGELNNNIVSNNIVNKIVKKIDSYRNTNTNSKRDDHNVKYDVDSLNYLTIGSGSGLTSKKSFGYPSSFEHNFQYISDDIQTPENVLFDRPYPTREFNKNYKKYSTRDII